MGVVRETYGGIVELSLDWPDVRNAMGPAEAHELTEALQRAAADAPGALVLSARGPAFCAGGNLPEILKMAEQGEAAVREAVYGAFQNLFRTLRAFPAPTIAAVDGPAIGFGCDLALACNLMFIGERGWLSQGWAKAGLIPATGGAFYAREKAGAAAPSQMLLKDRIDADDAKQMGLGLAALDARAAALHAGKRIAELPRAPVQALAKLTRECDFDAHLSQALDAQVGFLTDPRFAEAARKLAKL